LAKNHATLAEKTAGNISVSRQAKSSLPFKRYASRGKIAVPSTICVHAEPADPSPEEIAMAVAATSLTNIQVIQNWQGTNVSVAPMKNRIIERVVALKTKALRPQTIPPKKRTG